MSRRNQILAAVLAFQLVLVAVISWAKSAPVPGGEPLFLGLEADQVVRVTIHDEQGEHIELAKRTGNWVLPGAENYPCEEDQVAKLLEQIAGLKTDRLVTQTRASHERLKVSEQIYAHSIEVESADGTGHKLYLGTSPSYSVIHVRAEVQDQVYLASGLSSADVSTRAANWVDTLYFSVPQDQVVAVTLENANGTFEFRKGDDDEWTMSDLAPDETLNKNNVTSLVNRVASVRMLRPLGKEVQESYGLQNPSAVVVIQAPDEDGKSKTYVLHVGAKSDEDDAAGASPSYVFKSSESPYYVRVAEYTAKDLVEKTRDDFLELPPTPTPTPAS